MVFEKIIMRSISREYPRGPVASVHTVVHRGNQVLLIKRVNPPSQGLRSIPGGVIEIGETIEEAAQREACEECGIEVEPGKIIAIEENIVPDEKGSIRFHNILIFTLAHSYHGDSSPASDVEEARWVTQDELSTLDMHPLARSVLEQAFQRIRLSHHSRDE